MPEQSLSKKTDKKIPVSNTAYLVGNAVRIVGNLSWGEKLTAEDSADLFDCFLNEHQKQQTDLLIWALLYCIECLPWATRNWVATKAHGYEGATAMTMRKHYVESVVRDFIKEHDDNAQVLVLAGGYDTMPTRLSLEFPNIDFYEADRGLTRQVKLTALEKLRNDPSHRLHRYAVERDNLHFVEMEHSASNAPTFLRETLEKSGFDAGKPTIIICEGLTMYLTPEDVEKLLESAHHLDNDQNQLMIGFLEKGKITEKAYNGRFFKRAGEGFQYPPAEEKASVKRMNASGYEVLNKIRLTDMLNKAMPGQPEFDFTRHFVAKPVAYKPQQDCQQIPHYELPEPDYKRAGLRR